MLGSRTLVPVVLVLAACAPRTPASPTPDVSVATLESMAADEERRALEHERAHDPGANERRARCRSGRVTGNDPCWISVTNPTAEQLKLATAHRERAADLRATSRALREAEARACQGLAQADRDASPFERREDITRVGPLYDAATGTGEQRLAGAVVFFRAVPALTAEWLQRVVDCHLARNAALGHDVPELPYCPLVPRGVRARVSQDRTGFTVELRADDPRTASEIARRAMMLQK